MFDKSLFNADNILQALFGSDANPNGLSQRQSWMAHNAGDIALILNNPPSYYIDGLAHRLFVDGRLHLVRTPLTCMVLTLCFAHSLACLAFNCIPNEEEDIPGAVRVDDHSMDQARQNTARFSD
jgi:hypothetical protein